MFKRQILASGGSWDEIGTYAIGLFYGNSHTTIPFGFEPLSTFSINDEEAITIIFDEDEMDFGAYIDFEGWIVSYDEKFDFVEMKILDHNDDLIFAYDLQLESNGGFGFVAGGERVMGDQSGIFTLVLSYDNGRVSAQEDFEFIGMTDRMRGVETIEDLDKPVSTDRVEPLLILPSGGIEVEATSENGAIVEFSAKAIDDVDGVIPIVCNPSSGSLFPIGANPVWCSAIDSAGNEADRRFHVVVKSVLAQEILQLPDWLKEVAGFWIKDEIGDSDFVQVITYLIENDVIVISYLQPHEGGEELEIPDWIKSNTEFWIKGQISDEEFANGIEWLINN